MKSVNLNDNQNAAIEHLNKWKVGALFMEPGTGKTRAAMEMINSSPCDICLWFGPLSTIRPKDGIASVADEVEKWGGMKMPVKYFGVESIQGSDRIYHEALEAVENAGCPFVVVDESLKMKNAEAKRTRRLLEIGKKAEYKLILNGTPISRNLMDMWSQMEFLSPKILNMPLKQFRNTFCEVTSISYLKGYRRYSREFISGYENVDYLYSLIRHYIYECDLHLNVSQNFRNVYYEISDDERQKYFAIKDKFLSLDNLLMRNNNIFMEMTTLMQRCYNLSEGKIEALKKLFSSIPEEDTIIFCRFIDSGELCRQMFPKALVLSYQKESYGLNLQRYNHTVYFDKVWDYALKMQSGRRTFRTGQEKNCYYYDLTGDVKLERLIDKNIDKKTSMSEYLKKVSIEQLKEDL